MPNVLAGVRKMKQETLDPPPLFIHIFCRNGIDGGTKWDAFGQKKERGEKF